MLTPEQEKALLESCPAARVKEEYITARIDKTEYHRLTPTLTVCVLTLDNGFSVTGESACVNPENYNQELGEHYSYKAAFGKLWPFFGFLLAEGQFQAKK